MIHIWGAQYFKPFHHKFIVSLEETTYILRQQFICESIGGKAFLSKQVTENFHPHQVSPYSFLTASREAALGKTWLLCTWPQTVVSLSIGCRRFRAHTLLWRSTQAIRSSMERVIRSQ